MKSTVNLHTVLITIGQTDPVVDIDKPHKGVVLINQRVGSQDLPELLQTVRSNTAAIVFDSENNAIVLKISGNQ